MASAGSSGKENNSFEPLVSVVTVCLNSEKHLAETISSVRGQTYKKIEHIIIDGGSTDGTLEIIKKFADRIAYWTSGPDKGMYDAMNKGVALAKGDLIGILNSDDYYQPNAVEIIVNESRKDKEAGVFCGEVLFFLDESNGTRVTWRRRLTNLGKFGQEVVHPATFVKKEVYEKFRYDIRYRLASDIEFVYRLYFNGVKFHTCPGLIANYRVGGASRRFWSISDVFRIHGRYFGPRCFLRNATALLFQSAKWCLKNFVLGGNVKHPFLRWHRRFVNPEWHREEPGL